MTETRDLPNELVIMEIWDHGKLILQHRTHKDGGIGCWGGRLQEGEEPIDGVLREVREETGAEIDPRHVSYLGEFKYGDMKVHAFQTNRQYLDGNLELTEGEKLEMYPHKAYEDERIMDATKLVLEQTIIIPNGTIDN